MQYVTFLSNSPILQSKRRQVLRQLIYFIVSISLNQLLVRRDLCNWTKAMQLRYNVSQIEEFLSRWNMTEGPIIKELNPLVQSSQLMQAKKQDENDAKLLLQMCDSLAGAQVLKLLQLITPVHEYEEVVPARFLYIFTPYIHTRIPICPIRCGFDRIRTAA